MTRHSAHELQWWWCRMYLVAIGWLYVVVMMAMAEALSTQGTVLGAVVTFVLYGLLPISIVLYVMGAPLRGRKRRAAEAADAQVEVAIGSRTTPDGSGLPAGDTIPAEREKV